MESIAKLATFFGTTPRALAEKDHVTPHELKGLNREDLEIARAYHEASTAVRTQARQLLRDRDPQDLPPPTGEAAALVERIAQLTPARRQLLLDMLTEWLEPHENRDTHTG